MPDVRRGFVTQLGTGWEEPIDRARDLGLDHVELMMDGDTAREELAAEADEIRAAADDAGVDLLVHLPFSLDAGSPYEHVRNGSVEELRACIETAAMFGAEKAVMHASSDAWTPAWDDEHVRDLILDAIREVDASAADHCIEVCVENIPEGFFTVHDFDRLFDETDAAMTLDTGHAHVDGMDSAEMGAFLEEHRDRVSHLHLNDARTATDDHVPFGSGTLDFDAILSPLADGWTGTLSLEVFTYSWDYIRYSQEHLDDLLDDLF